MIRAPTTRAEWSSIWQAVHRTMTTPGLLPLALFVAILVATVSAVARRLPFVAEVLAGDLPVALELEFLLLYLPLIGGLPDGLPDVVGLLVAAVAGVTVAVLLGETVARDGGASGSSEREAGLVLGSLAVLVAALGPALLAGVAGIVGANGVLASFPLEGLEASVLAVPAMLLAIFWVVGSQDGSADGSS